jgi:Flp pilus assembly pilin Flp
MNTSLQVQTWLLRRPKGQTMAEYALILAAIAVIAYAGFQLMGSVTLSGILDEIREELS